MKHLKNKLITLLGISCLGMTVLLTPTTALTAQAAVADTQAVSPCADSIGYRYKEVNGKLYRRLYNYTSGVWIGDWEYIADV